MDMVTVEHLEIVQGGHMESKSTKNQRLLTESIRLSLGGKCNSQTCRWVNADGSIGCTDSRALQIDLIHGGERVPNDPPKKHATGIGNLYQIKKSIASGAGKYQLLCANCNWIKRHINKEARGFNQHSIKPDTA